MVKVLASGNHSVGRYTIQLNKPAGEADVASDYSVTWNQTGLQRQYRCRYAGNLAKIEYLLVPGILRHEYLLAIL